MRWFIDCCWLLIALLSLPFLLPGLLRRGWFRTDWAGRRGRCAAPPEASASVAGPHVLLAAVSVGEVNAIRALVPALLDAGARVSVAVTTDTGIARAKALFEGRAHVVRYPLDMSGWVRRFLDTLQPDVVGLVELEVWPNFLGACRRRGVPVQVIGGRLSERSFHRYRLGGPLTRWLFGQVVGVHAQSAAIAERFVQCGAPHVEVTSSLKWDVMAQPPEDAEVDALARDMGIDRARPVIVVGSSAPEEHALMQDATPECVQLVVAPRRPEWWDDAAAVFAGCARRSDGSCGSATDRFLLDSIGDLSAAYVLADLVIIGRSFAARHGSDPLEPAGMGKAVICGPAMDDFASSMDVLRQAEGIVQCTPDALKAQVASLMHEASARAALGQRAQAAIEACQGASDQAAARLLSLAE